MSSAVTMAEAWLARRGDPNPGLRFEDDAWSWSEVVNRAVHRASLWSELRLPGPPHIALLLDNVPEHVWWLGACALSGSVVVGANPTHPGPALADELAHTACQLLVTDVSHLGLVDGLDLGPGIGVVSRDNPRVIVVDADGLEAPAVTGAAEEVAEAKSEQAVAPLALGDSDSSMAYPADPVEPSTLGYLIFTSGTSGAPKACRCTQGRMALYGSSLAQRYELGPGSTCYLAMPLFHSNALMAGWSPAVVGGAEIALPTRGRFSASGFLPDVRRHGATYFNYVGRPLSYVLATPERTDDADNPLTHVFGNEAAPGDVDRFARRFGCHVSENYGSTEGGVAVSRTAETPLGAMGRVPEGGLVLHEDGSECSIAEFDAEGRLANAADAVGELVSTTASAVFEGYWENDEANEKRTRQGRYWTGDLVYLDRDGFLWFAGRADDWLRVDGENFAAAPVVRVVERHPDVVMAAIYAVPDPTVGDQVMVAVQLRPGAVFDGEEFARFLGDQPDLGPKWWPRYVRVSDELPTTATAKILVRQLRLEGIMCADPVWERSGGPGSDYVAVSSPERQPASSTEG
jgi:fatty-acyl-CoA synthase